MIDIIEEARSLVSLVDYQEDSVVSKEVIRKEKGTVTLFAFDKGQGLSEHTAPANKPHALKASERFKMMLVMVKL